MIHWREGTIEAIRRMWWGAVEVDVVVADGASAGDRGAVRSMRAIALTSLVGTPGIGDRVLLNVSALRKGLGTGGHAFVVALPDRLPPDPEGPGHIVKARYTPLQTMVCAIEEQESPLHEQMATHPAIRAGDLQGMPVVVAELHSAIPAILAGIRAAAPQARVAYVMTDSAALPLPYSRSIATLVERGWLATTISAGQAFGGEYEAISVHSALLAARHVLDCDAVVLAQGPGNAGSATVWGHSGLGVGDSLNAVSVLRGTAVAALRVSEADPRERHRGLSHHAWTALGRMVLGQATLVLPNTDIDPWPAIGEDVERLVASAAGDLSIERVSIDGLAEDLGTSPVSLSTMGRDLEQDPAAFVAAGSAGRWVGSLLSQP